MAVTPDTNANGDTKMQVKQAAVPKLEKTTQNARNLVQNLSIKPEPQRKPEPQTLEKLEEKTTFWGYVSIYDPVQFLTKIDEQKLIDSANQIGLSLKEVGKGAPLTIFMWDPKSGPIFWKDWKKLPIILFIPNSMDNQFSSLFLEKIKKFIPEIQLHKEFSKEGFFLFFNQRSQILLKRDLKGISQIISQLSKKKDEQHSLFIHLEVEPILESLKLPFEDLILGEETKIGPTGKYVKEKWLSSHLKERVKKYQTPEVKAFFADALISWLSNIQSIDIHPQFLSSTMKIGLELERKQEFAVEEKREKKSFISFFPTSLIQFQISFDYISELFEGEEGTIIMPGFLSAPFEKEKPELSEKLEELWSRFSQESKGMEISCAMNPDGDTKLFLILQPKDSTALMKVSQEFMDLLHQLPSFQNKMTISQKPNHSLVSVKSQESKEWSLEIIRKERFIYIRMGTNQQALESVIKAVTANVGKLGPSKNKNMSSPLSVGELNIKKAVLFLLGEKGISSPLAESESTVSWSSNLNGNLESISLQIPKEILSFLRNKIDQSK